MTIRELDKRGKSGGGAITPIRFPPELKEELQHQAMRHRLSMNDIVITGTQRIVNELKTKKSMLE